MGDAGGRETHKRDIRPGNPGFLPSHLTHQQPAFDEYRGPELAPGPASLSDSQLDSFIRAKADSAYHPSCTCKVKATAVQHSTLEWYFAEQMGSPDDEMAVVDHQGRVLGLQGLRVVDASVMPSIVRCVQMSLPEKYKSKSGSICQVKISFT